MRFTTILAILILSGCVSQNPLDVTNDRLEAANAMYLQGSLTEAEYQYRAIIKDSPGLSSVWFRLGNIYIRTNQYTAAISAFERATQLNPNEEQYWINLAYARLKQAQEVIQNGLLHHPNSETLEKLFYLSTGQNDVSTS